MLDRSEAIRTRASMVSPCHEHAGQRTPMIISTIASSASVKPWAGFVIALIPDPL